jgi:hypothetical protein
MRFSKEELDMTDEEYLKYNQLNLYLADEDADDELDPDDLDDEEFEDEDEDEDEENAEDFEEIPA